MGKSTNNGGKVYETRCKVCGKNIALIYTEMYTYRRQYKGKTEYYCGWTCMQQADRQHVKRGRISQERAEYYRIRCADIVEMHDNGCGWNEIADKWRLSIPQLKKIYTDRYRLLQQEEAEAK